MKTPELTPEEWRYVQQVICSIASENLSDLLAQSIRSKCFEADVAGYRKQYGIRLPREEEPSTAT